MKSVKSVAALLCAAILMLCAVSCSGGGEAPKGMKLIESDFVDYRLYVPENWTIDLSTGFVSAAASDRSNISMQTMTVTGQYASLDSYVTETYMPMVSSTLQGYKLLESYTTGQILGDSGACKYVYSVTSDNSEYKIMQVFATKSVYLYIFTYTAATENFDTHLSEVTTILENFSF